MSSPASSLQPPASSSGFTLIELLVALSVFVVLLGTVGGVYFTFVTHHRRQFASQALQQDLQNFLETLDREVRTGFGTFFIVGLDASGLQEFALINQNGQCVNYGLGTPGGANDGRLLRATSDPVPPALRCADPPLNLDVQTGVPLTARGTDIQRITFAELHPQNNVGVDGVAGTQDDYLTGPQGRVTVLLRACPRGRPAAECIDAQTTMTSRQVNEAP